MRLYIDKENIIAFMKNRSNDEDLFYECVRLVKQGIEVYYNFPKEEYLSCDELKVWFGKMKGTGVKLASSFCTDAAVKPERPVKTNFYVNYDIWDRSSIFLLNIEENICNLIRDKWSVLIGRPGEEMEIFKILLGIPERPGMMADIKSWADYCPKVPLTDVIICDNYYFVKDVYDKNDNELIRALATIPKDSFNVVIITSEKGNDKHAICNLEKECVNIKELISSVSGLSKKKCSVTILTTNKIHSRHIITNYYRISPTTSIHLKSSGLKEDADISITSHVGSQQTETTNKLIKLFQSIALSPVKIFGDKNSNFIKFE